MIHSFDKSKEITGVEGEVIETKASYARVKGLAGSSLDEIVTFENGIHGMVVEIEKDMSEILLLSREDAHVGMKVSRTGSSLSITLGEGLMGHTIDAFGHTKDERRFKSDFPDEREVFPKGVVSLKSRNPVKDFFATGVPIVDFLVPIGRGQRELVIGDRKTGKTQFLLQTAVAQAKMGKVVIWGSIGKKKEEIKRIEKFFQSTGIEGSTVIVASDSYDSPGEIFISPYTAMTVAEYFRDKGMDVALILDDLTTHAKYYREFSLIGKRFPGREFYPGDVFNIHSKLLERAGSFLIDGKESTITCLPVAESIAGDITGYIQTNLMSMTDGHIYFDNEVFLKGVAPAVNIFLSVTRVGRQTQSILQKQIAQKIHSTLKEYEEIQRFMNFGPEIGADAKTLLEKGKSILTFFNQRTHETLLPNEAMLAATLILEGVIKGEIKHLLHGAYERSVSLQELTLSLITSSNEYEVFASRVRAKSETILREIRKVETK